MCSSDQKDQDADTMDDPALSRFLALLARDISAHPERLLAVDANLRQRAQSLVEGIAVDLDAPL